MPNWKKVITSGSDASFSSLFVSGPITASVFTGSFTGSLFGTSSWAESSSQALTASYLLGGSPGSPGGPEYSIQFKTGSQFSGSSNFTYDAPNNTVYLTGSLVNIDINTSRSLDTFARELRDAVDGRSVAWDGRELYSSNGNLAADWENRNLYDGTGISADWGYRNLVWTDFSTVVVDWKDLQLKDNNGILKVWWSPGRNYIYDDNTSQSIAWGDRQLKNGSEVIKVDWGDPSTLYDGNTSGSVLWSSRVLKGETGVTKVDWGNAKNVLRDDNTTQSIAWGSRQLRDASGVLAAEWSGAVRRLYDSFGTQSIDWRNRYLLDINQTRSIDYANKNLRDQNSNIALQWSDTGSSNGVRLFGTASFALTASFLVGSVNSAAQVETQQTGSTSTFYLTFVDSANASPTAETVYTTAGGTKALYVIPDTTNPTLFSNTISASLFYSLQNITSTEGFVGTSSWASSASHAVQTQTQRTSTNATYHLTFVDSNNSTPISELLYTSTNPFTYNPSTAVLAVTNVSASSLTGSLQGTASFAQTASYVTASNVFGPNGSNSIATASFVTSIKSGVVATFNGNPKTGSVTFGTAYPNTNYAVTVTGGTGVVRSWTVESKTTTGFIINSNSNTAISNEVNWIAVSY